MAMNNPLSCSEQVVGDGNVRRAQLRRHLRLADAGPRSALAPSDCARNFSATRRPSRVSSAR